MRLVAATLVCAGLAVGQTPQFEVASVKISPPLPTDRFAHPVVGMKVDGARVDIRQLNIVEMVHIAWEAPRFQIVAPDWMKAIRFDVTATLPAGATTQQVPAMLRALLADRLKLQIHKQSRMYPVYALIIAADGPKFRKSEPDPQTPPDAPSVSNKIDSNGEIEHIHFSKATMAIVAEVLTHNADRPVLDRTGLDGEYDLTVDISLREFRERLTGRAESGDSGPATLNVFRSAQRLGLKLEPRKESLETIVIDHLEKTPTEN